VNYRDPAPSPVEVGATYEVDIEEASREGQGIARLHDCVVFVPNAKPGDYVKVKILRRSQLAADAEILP
jgi:predicted RNA-binding protein with TRAM domain